MSDVPIRRHTRAGILIHWFNAICWFFLLATGLGLIRNPDLNPIGAWWPNLMRTVFGNGENLLAAHWIAGLTWAGVWLIFIIAGLLRHTLPFLRQMITFTLPRDVEWLIKKNIQMLVGYKLMAALVALIGWNGRIPDSEYYNAGQKAAAIPLILGALVLLVTGLIMVASNRYLNPADVPLVQWSILIHYITAGLTLAVLFVHIFMASISREERPAFWSMFTGTVPATYARHHHRLWYEQVKKETT